MSVLHPDVCGGSHEGLLAVHSLSKRSNLAGYRAGFVTGDPGLIAELLEIRKHAGLMRARARPGGHDRGAERRRARRARSGPGTRRGARGSGPRWRRRAGPCQHSEAGLYLWAAHPAHDCWGSVHALAEAGILVAPGEFYGPAGERHVRVALTATDERIDAAVARLAALA